MSTATKAPVLDATVITRRLRAAGVEVLSTRVAVDYSRDNAGVPTHATVLLSRGYPHNIDLAPAGRLAVATLIQAGYDASRREDVVTVTLAAEDGIELEEDEELELVVVPCSGAKLEQAAPAGELYTGTLHAAARAAAGTVTARRGGRTVVLSALYGLVELDRVVDPYNLTVGDAGAIDAVGVALQLAATGATRVVALTPNRYTELLRQACKAAGVELATPLAGCRGIGEQRGRLARIRRGELDVVRAA